MVGIHPMQDQSVQSPTSTQTGTMINEMPRYTSIGREAYLQTLFIRRFIRWHQVALEHYGPVVISQSTEMWTVNYTIIQYQPQFS